LISNRKLFNFVMDRASGNEYLKRSVTRMVDDLKERKRLWNPLWYLHVLRGR